MQYFAKARNALMAPFHNDDENEGFRWALYYSKTAMEALEEEDPEGQHDFLDVVERALDTSGVEQDHPDGIYAAKARELTRSEKGEFSSVLKNLASHFTIKHYSKK